MTARSIPCITPSMSETVRWLDECIHAYFAPKLLLIALGLGNAALFHRTSYLRTLAAQGGLPWAAQRNGAGRLAFWTGPVICCSLNAESVAQAVRS